MQDPEVRVRVPSGVAMHAALVDAVRTMARRRAFDDAVADRMATATGAAATLVDSTNPSMLELAVHVGDEATEITVSAVAPTTALDANSADEFAATAERAAASVDIGRAVATLRFLR